jgi:CheY-like chemotaxis protein
MLAPLGFAVIEASNGREAVERAQVVRPDMILMDVVMPELDGLEATRRLRAVPMFAQVPILAVSASASTDDEERYLKSGMNAFLPKPLCLHALLEQIGALLHLAWTVESQPEETLAEQHAILPLESPPSSEMEVLHRLARLGNMSEILAHATHIGGLNERYRPFAQHLTTLAKTYQSKAILKFVEEYLEKPERT